ncbi:MAG: hypothetical protein FJ308_15735, partial [Planctomycetes bacterium]|nr:hypothetical protein [Planctomycetota bacterium]
MRIFAIAFWVLTATYAKTTHGWQEDMHPASVEILADHPTYIYPPDLSPVSGGEAFRSGLPSSLESWRGVASQGVQLDTETDDIVGSVAVFDVAEKGFVELEGSIGFRSPNVSVELWFRSEQSWYAKYWPGSATLVSKFTSGWASSDWGIIGGSLNEGVNEGRILVGVGPSGGGDVVLASPPGLNDGRFHHLVWTRTEKGENVLYVDGKVADRARDNAGSIVNERPIQVGGDTLERGGQYFSGTLSSVAIYSHALSDDRVRAHYDSVKIAPHLPPPSDREVDFATDIKPLLARFCYDCHGPGLDQGGLSLATRIQSIEGGESGPSIRVGNSESSPLIHRITGIDPEKTMPPDRD